MTLEGGLRDRMILESILHAIEDNMTTQGWFAAGRHHEPITIVDEYPNDDDEVAVNTIAFSMGNVYREIAELGSNATEVMIPLFIDIYAESDGLGRHVAGDIATFMQQQGGFPIYDYSLSTPSSSFSVNLEENSVQTVRPARAINPWQRHWFTVTAVFVDFQDAT